MYRPKNVTGNKIFQEMLSPFLKKELEFNLNSSFSKALRPLPILLMINEKGRGFHLLLLGISHYCFFILLEAVASHELGMSFTPSLTLFKKI